MHIEKRRPTLEELRLLPVQLWQMEILQTASDAREAGREDVKHEALEMLMLDLDLTPEKIIALREKLTGGTGSTEVETAA